MGEKCPVFEELEGWAGDSYDWTSVARTVIAEELPQLEDAVSFDSETDVRSLWTAGRGAESCRSHAGGFP